MSVNTESTHDNRELPGILWISFSRAQKAGPKTLTLVYLSTPCALAQQPPPPAALRQQGRTYRARTPAGFREKGPSEAAASGALAESSFDLPPGAGRRVLELQAATATSGRDAGCLHQVAGVRPFETASLAASVRQRPVLTPGRCLRLVLRVFLVGRSSSLAGAPISLMLSKYGCCNSCSHVSLSAGFMWRQP